MQRYYSPDPDDRFQGGQAPADKTVIWGYPRAVTKTSCKNHEQNRLSQQTHKMANSTMTVQTPPDGHITIFINTLESKLLYNPAHNSVSARSLVEDQLANQKNSVQSYINSTMSTSSNFSYFQLSGDQSQYVHPINFNYFQGYGKQATNLTMF
jgi:hypothetical protein